MFLNDIFSYREKPRCIVPLDSFLLKPVQLLQNLGMACLVLVVTEIAWVMLSTIVGLSGLYHDSWPHMK
jgi:hypothetical protein